MGQFRGTFDWAMASIAQLSGGGASRAWKYCLDAEGAKSHGEFSKLGRTIPGIGYRLSKIQKVCFHMVLSYARGSWQFKVASLVASSVAVAVRYGNVGGSFSGNEALVASLMAECDGKNGGNRILVAKGVATLHGKN